MAKCELQLEARQFLLELARHPDSVHKSPTNHYQHFVNAFVVTNNMKMKRADAVKRASRMEGASCLQQRALCGSTEKSCATLEVEQDKAY